MLWLGVCSLLTLALVFIAFDEDEWPLLLFTPFLVLGGAQTARQLRRSRRSKAGATSQRHSAPASPSRTRPSSKPIANRTVHESEPGSSSSSGREV